MKRIIPALFLIFLVVLAFAQKRPATPPPKIMNRPTLSKTDFQKMKAVEDSLAQLADIFTDDTDADSRKKACYQFIPKLVRALKTDNSFYYPFDSLATIARIYPPDSSFRIFTWQLYFTAPIKVSAKYSKTGRDTFFLKPVVRYYGAIQMRSKELKMYPLFDASDTLTYGTQQTLSPNNWWGQLYYNIIEKTVAGKNYYTLFGFEAPDQFTRRKIIDIMTFNKQGLPQFGAPLFYFKYTDSTQVKMFDTLSRFFIEYKWSAVTTLNYNPEMEMIVFDHVAPPSDKAKGATFTYVPDGTYEGFTWLNDHWQWVEKVFTFAINEDDNPPIPSPLFGTPKRQPQLPKDGDPR